LQGVGLILLGAEVCLPRRDGASARDPHASRGREVEGLCAHKLPYATPEHTHESTTALLGWLMPYFMAHRLTLNIGIPYRERARCRVLLELRQVGHARAWRLVLRHAEDLAADE
jgi:hypothetical protein